MFVGMYSGEGQFGRSWIVCLLDLSLPCSTQTKRPVKALLFWVSFTTMASHSQSSSTANLVGVHYRVGKKIGEGSFGVIFEGRAHISCPSVA